MKNKIFILYFIIVILLVGNVFQFGWNNNSNNLFTDAVPDEETALKIAEAVLVSAYGENVLLQPLNVRYNESKKAWVVTGTLPYGWVGGVPVIVIRKSDGMIMQLSHGE
ncbi:MAG: YbbC/YhhH family protein [Methanosarcinales archaeon]|jgi:hypothetical protein|nr:YbbC/YhhH family protein [Methanosarcinales archaeon]